MKGIAREHKPEHTKTQDAGVCPVYTVVPAIPGAERHIKMLVQRTIGHLHILLLHAPPRKLKISHAVDLPGLYEYRYY